MRSTSERGGVTCCLDANRSAASEGQSLPCLPRKRGNLYPSSRRELGPTVVGRRRPVSSGECGRRRNPPAGASRRCRLTAISHQGARGGGHDSPADAASSRHLGASRVLAASARSGTLPVRTLGSKVGCSIPIRRSRATRSLLGEFCRRHRRHPHPRRHHWLRVPVSKLHIVRYVPLHPIQGCIPSVHGRCPLTGHRHPSVGQPGFDRAVLGQWARPPPTASRWLGHQRSPSICDGASPLS